MGYLDKMPDGKLPDKLDKIRAYLMDPENNKLESRLMESLKKYKMAITFMLENRDETTGNTLNSPRQAIDYLENRLEYSYSQATKIVRETLELYGNVFQYSKESLKYLHYERLMRLSNQARYADDYKAAARIEKEAIELMDLKNPDAIDKKQILQFFQINISRSTDPGALQNTVDIPSDDD